jgi:tRNA-dihydrouridine synthase 4
MYTHTHTHTHTHTPFRSWGADIAYTPMLLAESFNDSQYARDFFMTSPLDRPVVAQFAACTAAELAGAASKLAGHVCAVDINCGCPQRWVMADGLGAALLRDPELIKDMVRTTREASGLPVSVKIRLLPGEARETIELARQLESAGIAWLGVHGRTVKQRSSVPADTSTIALLRTALTVPVVHNGDVWGEGDVSRVHRDTNVHGVMAARGALRNPALYHRNAYSEAPDTCVGDFLALALSFGGSFQNIRHHVYYMLAERLTTAETGALNQLTTVQGLLEFLTAWDPRVLETEAAPGIIASAGAVVAGPARKFTH